MAAPLQTSFDSGHASYILDLAYDYHGKRLATCSSDHRVSVFDLDGREWRRTATLHPTHAAAVTKVAWAHPEYGQVLATCGADRAVKVYEERGRPGGERQWREVTTQTEAGEAVRDVQFAPRHHGLKLAWCDAAGIVRLYEAMDVMNLSQWSSEASFAADEKECTSLSWNPSPFEPPMMVVGGRGGAAVWEYNEQVRSWQRTTALPGHRDTVHGVAWAPNMGRSYHLVATACKDRRLRVFRLSRERGAREFAVKCVAELADHDAEVWRVQWNVTGTVLASTGDDGSCRLWAADALGEFQAKAVVSASERDREMLPAGSAPFAAARERQLQEDALSMGFN